MTRDERRNYRYFRRNTRRVIWALILFTALIITLIYLNFTLKSQFVQAAVMPEVEAVFKEETTSQVIEQDFPSVKSLGAFKITFYCGEPTCKICGGGGNTTSGTPVREGTIATDPEVIPLGTTVIIDGEEYIAEDTGAWVKGNHIDMFIAGSHQDALNRGKIEREVFVYENDFK